MLSLVWIYKEGQLMLVEFTVKNYRSIKDEQVFSLAKGKEIDETGSHSFEPKAPATDGLLRSAVIYGPNAAGKSNVIRAMMQMESIIRTSASSQEGDEIDVIPFLFDDESTTEPSEFEMVFISEGTRYQYGFSTTRHHIVSEWLIAYPNGRPQRWFARGYDEKKQSPVYKFGDSLIGQKSVWKNATRRNALFLSTAVQLNNDQLKPVFNWFNNMLRLTNVRGWGTAFSASLCEKESTKDLILSFLKAADFNIHDIQVDKEKFDPELLPNEIPDSVKEKIIEDLKDKDIFELKTIHKTSSNKLVSLEFKEESDGTQKFFSFAGPWIDALQNGYILVIDELHDNLHPKMVKYLVDLFHNDKSNPKNAQLIFTTHETSILNQDVFRRDQVWFCEKTNEQATELYPLTDFSPRKGRENIEQGYLSGRYGALPFVRDFDLSETV